MTGHASAQRRFILYISRYCGYCFRVLSAVKQMGADQAVETVDVSRYPERRRDIIDGTGRRTVPVLYIGADVEPDADSERWLFESRAIVAYLRTQFDNAC